MGLILARSNSTPLGNRPLGTLRPLERLLELLIDAGFRPPVALRIYRIYVGFVYSHILTELQDLIVDPEETDDLLRLGLNRLPLRDFPVLRSLAADLAHYDGVAELDHGLDILFAGLDTRLHGHPDGDRS